MVPGPANADSGIILPVDQLDVLAFFIKIQITVRWVGTTQFSFLYLQEQLIRKKKKENNSLFDGY